MKKLFISFAVIVSMVLPAQAARVAVVDSGTDFEHEWLKGRDLINVQEKAGNRVDDDRNGKVDDVHGWNFVDNYGKVFFRNHLPLIDESIFTIFEVMARIQDGTASAEDLKFWQDEVISLPQDKKTELVGRLNYYGQYSHGTHVSGIVAKVAPQAKIMAGRVFADELPAEPQSLVLPGLKQDSEQESGGTISRWMYKLLALLANTVFQQVGSYLGEREIDVANYSLGVPLRVFAQMALGLKGNKNPTEEEIAKETRIIAAQYEPQGRAWMAMAPKTLFVIAAGNDGTNNDVIPVFPANVKASNAITVAASKGYTDIADFSNYGIRSVDVAAPGVSIVASVPSLDNNKTLPMSGTSMAAPYVAGVAAHMKTLNPSLTAEELKMILMSTVDKKEWLAEKVTSGGVVNHTRAYRAAELAKTMLLDQAISTALAEVADVPVTHQPLHKRVVIPQHIKDSVNQFVF